MDKDLAVLFEFLSMPVETVRPVTERFRGLDGAVFGSGERQEFVYIPGTRGDRVLLAAHSDTYWDGKAGSPSTVRVPIMDRGLIRSGTRGIGLGADDRAGCAILWLLRDLGHSLLVVSGEENGRLGISMLMRSYPEIAAEINDSHGFAIEFDRRNGSDFKCYDVGSDDFRRYVGSVTGYAEPDRRSFTDITVLCRRICGANLSIGYHDEHTEFETLDVSEWRGTLEISRRWLSSPILPRFTQDGRWDVIR